MIVPTQKGGMAPSAEQPSEANLLMALAEMHKQGRFQVAGDVVPLEPKLSDKADQESQNDILRRATRETLSRATGKNNVLQMTPRK